METVAYRYVFMVERSTDVNRLIEFVLHTRKQPEEKVVILVFQNNVQLGCIPYKMLSCCQEPDSCSRCVGEPMTAQRSN